MFEKILEVTLGHEGGYANNANDAGKETYCGISRRYHPQWDGWSMVDAAKMANGGSLAWNTVIKSTELERRVIEFYRSQFWDKYKIGYINDNNIQAIVFDSIVNSGKRAMMQVQQVLRTLGKDVKVDGYIGLKTVEAINSCNAKDFYDRFKTVREDFYKALAKTGTNSVFLKGWLSRIQSHNYVGVVGFGFLTLISVGGFFLPVG